MTKLRVVNASDVPLSLSKQEAIESVMRECMAADPTTVIVAWEVGGELHSRVVPASPSVFTGMIYLLYRDYLEGIDE